MHALARSPFVDVRMHALARSPLADVLMHAMTRSPFADVRMQALASTGFGNPPGCQKNEKKNEIALEGGPGAGDRAFFFKKI